MDTRKRNIGFDCLRATACLFIVLLHTTNSTVVMYAQEMTFWRSVGAQIVINNLMWCVPCFVMVTGALLLPAEKKITYRALFSKYIARTVKAIVVFGVLFVALEVIFNPAQRTMEHVLDGLYKIFAGDSWAHMWYLYCLLGLYILLPAYKKIAALSDEKDIRYLLIVYAIFRSLMPLLRLGNIKYGIDIHVSSIYPFWLFLGYYLCRWGAKRSRSFYMALFAVSTALITALTYVRMKWGVTALDALFSYTSILVIGQTIGLAGWFFQCREEGFGSVKKCLANIDRHSFGIYLIHMAYVRLIYKHLHFDPYRLGLGGVPGILLVVLVAFVLAYLTDMVMKKLPVFKSIV